MKGNFFTGFSYPFQTIGFIRRHPRLYAFIIMPFAINLVVFSTAVYLGLDFFNRIVSRYIPQGEAWFWLFFHYFLWTAAILLTMIMVFFCFTAIGCLIASPFNEILSEKTEALLTGKENREPFVLRIFLKDLARTLFDESRKIGLFFLGMVLLLLLNLLPGLGSALYAVLSTLWTIFFLVIEYTGYIFARKHKSFKEQHQFIMARKLLHLGFGTGLLCILAIPFLQFLCIPLGVVGATRLYCDAIEAAESDILPGSDGKASPPKKHG